jgi:hypothetical protein
MPELLDAGGGAQDTDGEAEQGAEAAGGGPLKGAEKRIVHMKENLYDRIPVSVGTMDKVIVALIVLIALFVAVGIIKK